MKLSAIGGLISAAFLSVLLIVAFGAAFHYWQQLQLPRVGPRKKQRMRKLMRIWVIAAIGVAAIGLAGAAVYLFAPTAILIQPPEKPYVTIKEIELEPFVVGKKPVMKMRIESGPGTSSISFADITFKLTPFVPEKYLKYNRTNPSVSSHQSFDFTPHQIYDVRWEAPDDLILTQDQIDDLTAEKPALELYVFARGRYRTESETGSRDVCFQYDRRFPNHLALCQPDVKVE